MSTVTLRRLTMLFCGIAVWTLMLTHILSIQEAGSQTPVLNNIRRALNECKVFGRLAQEVEGNVTFISYNSRIVCDQNAASPR